MERRNNFLIGTYADSLGIETLRHAMVVGMVQRRADVVVKNLDLLPRDLAP